MARTRGIAGRAAAALVAAVCLLADVGAGEAARCGHPACLRTARHQPYVEPELPGFRTIEIDGFSVKVPPAPGQIKLSGRTLYLVYGDGSVLALGTAAPPPVSGGARSSITGAQLPETIFLRSAGDREPRAAADRAAWRLAINLKPYYFEGADVAFAARHRGVRYFISNGTAQGFSGRALVTKQGISHSCLQIDARNMDFQRFVSIVLSSR